MLSVSGSLSTDIPVKRPEKVDKMVWKARESSQAQSCSTCAGRGGFCKRIDFGVCVMHCFKQKWTGFIPEGTQH